MNKILVLGTADWDQPIATNQHYIVRELARTYRLIYTESLGLRTPELKMRDVRRMARRIGIGAPTARAHRRAVPAGVEVRSPKIIPRHQGLAHRINKPRVHSMVKDWISQDDEKVLWTYTPVTYGLEEIADSVVYHCVDLLGEVEGIPADLIADAERHLGQRATVALGTSPVVVEHLKAQGFSSVRYWPNVADVGAIDAAQPDPTVRWSGRAVFAGNLSATKVDFELLAKVIAAGLDLHLAGPIAEGGGRATAEVEDLVARGATYHGLLNPEKLARLYWSAEVGLIPYLLNDYTRGVSPLKTFEYLAAGLGVVSTPVPAVEAVQGHVEVARTHDGFVDAARAFAARSLEHVVEDRRKLAQANSWTGRGETARSLIAHLTAGPGVSGPT